MKLYESNLGGDQFICREICCFVHLARKNILQTKEKWLQPFLFFPFKINTKYN